jgi:hypothetical protein
MAEQAKARRKVGIYGSQLVISAIGASLQQKPGLDVQQIEGPFPKTTGQLSQPIPDVILFDLAAAQPHIAIPLIANHPAIMVIGVDLRNNKMLVLSGKEISLLTPEDLVQAIEAGAPE